MRCPHCGRQHPDDMKFCPFMGELIVPQHQYPIPQEVQQQVAASIEGEDFPLSVEETLPPLVKVEPMAPRGSSKPENDPPMPKQEAPFKKPFKKQKPAPIPVIQEPEENVEEEGEVEKIIPTMGLGWKILIIFLLVLVISLILYLIFITYQMYQFNERIKSLQNDIGALKIVVTELTVKLSLIGQ